MDELFLQTLLLTDSTIRLATPLVLAALLFGALYQGGSELSFDMPALSRDLVVVIQGLVILFAGALEHLFRPSLEALFARPRPAGAVA